MSSIRTSFTDLSLINVDAGYLVMTADLDGYLKVKTPSDSVIDITKNLGILHHLMMVTI